MPQRDTSPADDMPKASIGVVVLGAGKSRRMDEVDKIFAPLLGLPLIAHSLEVFNSSPRVVEIILVLSPDKIDKGRTLLEHHRWHKILDICAGGPRRQDSVRAGLERLTPCPWVMVHDGARPLVEPELLQRALEAVQETGAAVAAVPATDTVKMVSNRGLIEQTPPRESLWMVQTPQIFRYDLLLEAHRRCEETYTDDSAMVESLGHPAKVFMGSYRNLKVTTPEDLLLMETLLQRAKGRNNTP